MKWLLKIVALFALLFSATLAQAQTPPPVLFFSDLDSATNSGGESVSGFAGAYVTLYGNFFGSSQGTSTVTWNGINCLRVVPPVGSYTGWGMVHLWYQQIIVQLGSSCTPGVGNFVVTTPAGTSNSLSFTVRSTGVIHCISNTGSDSNSGSFPSSCWLTPKHAFSLMSAGDTTYWEGGVRVSTGGSFSALDWGAAGTAGNPVAMVTYPGASPQPGVVCNPCNSGVGIIAEAPFGGQSAYLTMAGLLISADTMAWRSEYNTANTNQRFVGNFYTCTGTSGQVGCVQNEQPMFVKYFGNEIANIVSVGGISKFYHSLYFTTDSLHVEVGWNSIHDNLSCEGIQFYSSLGHNEYDLSVHDNLIYNNPCTGLNFATVDPSQGKVEAYNNVIYSVGQGPDPVDGEEAYDCIRVANFNQNPPPNAAGTVEIYNNTMYDCGSHGGNPVTAFGHIGAVEYQGGAVGVTHRNNIVYQLSSQGEFYTANGQAPGGLPLAGSNSVWFGSTQATPTFTTGNITSDPLFVNRIGGNFALQSGSPAKGAGTPITSANTYHNNPPWQGAPARDINGLLRPVTPSIGAFDSGPPTFIWSTAIPLAVPSGSNWGGASPCGTNVPCYRIPLPEPTVAGATLVMAFGYDSTGANQVFTVTDNQSNTWVLDTTSSASNNKTIRMYRAANVVAGTTFITVTLTSGNQNGYWNALVSEFYNVGALDGSSCNTSSSTSINSGNITPTQTGDLIFQAKYSAGLTGQTNSFTPGSQSSIVWSLASQLLGDGAADQYGVYNSTATLNPTLTQATSDSYISCAIALQAASSGSAPTALPRVIHQEHDAMPKNAANPWHVGLVVDKPNVAVYLSYVGNDAISSVTSSPAPTVGWTASGPDFTGTNGHNHVNSYCASWASPPGQVNLSITRSATSNDSINMMYVVQNGTCNLDVDSGGQANTQGSIGPLTVCANCLTPTKQNDFIVSMGGEAFCTAIGLNSPGIGIFDSAWFTGNTIDGPTQTDENNFWSHLYNGSSLSPFTITYAEACDFAQGNWANRVVAYKSLVAGNPAASFSPSSLTFANQNVGTNSVSQPVTLTNTGTAAMTINSVGFSGTNPGDYSQTNNCPASLAVNANCVINVTFTPTAVGSRTANLSVVSNTLTSPDTISITGTGTGTAASAIFSGTVKILGNAAIR